MSSDEVETYYSMLATAGSYWGAKMHRIFISPDQASNAETENVQAQQIKKIAEERHRYLSGRTEVKEELTIYKLPFANVLAWLLTPTTLSTALVPLCAVALLLQPHISNSVVDPSFATDLEHKKFRITKDLVDQALLELPPTPTTPMLGVTRQRRPVRLNPSEPEPPPKELVPPTPPTALRIINPVP
jgi:hypothetical protein